MTDEAKKIETPQQFIDEIKKVKSCKEIVNAADETYEFPDTFIFGCQCAQDFVGRDPTTGKWHTMEIVMIGPFAAGDPTTVHTYDSLEEVCEAFKEMFLLGEEDDFPTINLVPNRR